MTVSIEYEAEKKLDLPYEKIIKEIRKRHPLILKNAL